MAPAIGGEAGVGRLNFGGYKTTINCTAFLTEHGHLVTAAHCLNLSNNAQFHFLDGYDRGDWTSQLRVLPDWFVKDAPEDVAVICKAQDAASDSFVVSNHLPEIGEQLEIWGYGAPRSHVLQRTPCSLLRTAENGTMILGCEISGGTSGAPVVRLQGERREAVGIVWGTSDDTAYATRLTRDSLERYCGN
ncbi:MAG: trypsin-like serine peptidase [Kiloniellales bacterium]